MILELPGLSRYDVQNCTITDKHIIGWMRTKNKLRLTTNECNAFFRQLKKDLLVNAVEEHTKLHGTILTFNKIIAEDQFNSSLRRFVQQCKICPNCHNPELVDGICQACSTSRSTIAAATATSGLDTINNIRVNDVNPLPVNLSKAKLTNAEKIELKKQRQRENAKSQSDDE
jgi:hypothetical protein